ncbi:LCP family protein [Patescibacteria group bacterium]|nr:LCP family protein [Patescibacteria group bacterium]
MIRGSFNFKPTPSNNRRTILITLSLSVFLFFLIALVLAPLLRPHWREIKSSSAATGAAVMALDNLYQNLYGAEPAKSADTQEPVNFLLLGAAGEGYDAPDLTDTILIARLIPQKKIYLFSLPRDLLIEIPGTQNWTKLNSLYAIGKKNKGQEFDLIKQKTEDISGLKISYSILIDLATVKELVDAVGGINVMVKKDIIDPAYPGPNHSYQTFEIRAGWRYLDGETALKYIRSRHSALGDFDRIERQQQVLQALKQKVLQMNFWDIPAFFNLFNAIASKIKTDLSLWEIKDFWEQTKDIPAQDTIKTEINNTDLVITGQVNFDGEMASVVRPKAGLEDYEQIKAYIAEIIK